MCSELRYDKASVTICDRDLHSYDPSKREYAPVWDWDILQDNLPGVIVRIVAVSITKSMTPHDHTSAIFPSYSRPMSTSGAAHAPQESARPALGDYHICFSTNTWPILHPAIQHHKQYDSAGPHIHLLPVTVLVFKHSWRCDSLHDIELHPRLDICLRHHQFCPCSRLVVLQFKHWVCQMTTS